LGILVLGLEQNSLLACAFLLSLSGLKKQDWVGRAELIFYLSCAGLPVWHHVMLLGPLPQAIANLEVELSPD
jgi:hypothetical protein